VVLFNYSTKELTAKVVYYGPGLCGKTTNLQWIHEKLPIKNKGKMLSLATETDRTLFFDFLPIELGTIRGMKTRIQLYTVPGQVFYNATRRMVLKGADCVVFIADSQEAMLEANLESLENLRQNLEANELDPREIPMVMQYNKRDLPNALPIEILNERLNPRGLPFYEAVAIKGLGVEETLKGVTQLVFRSLANKYGGDDTPVPAPSVAAAAPRAPAPRPVPAPPPPPPPAPQAPPPPPRPIAVMPPATDDSLLDSLELQPAPEVDPDLGLPLSDPVIEPPEEIIALDIELSEPHVPAPPPPRGANPEAAKTTLVSGPKETDELRRKIATPPVPDLTLEELGEEEDDEDFEAISLRHAPPPPAPVKPPPPPRPPTPAPPPPSARPAPVGPRAGVTTIPPVPPVANPVSSLATPPVSVSLPNGGAVSDVTIPVEVRVGEGEAQVTIHIRLSLSLKLQP
jgi:signal recognition particle receptor subunit beta